MLYNNSIYTVYFVSVKVKKYMIITKQQVQKLIEKHFGDTSNQEAFIEELFKQDKQCECYDNILLLGENIAAKSDDPDDSLDIKKSYDIFYEDGCSSFNIFITECSEESNNLNCAITAKFNHCDEWSDQIDIRKGSQGSPIIYIENTDDESFVKGCSTNELIDLFKLKESLACISKFIK